MVQRGFQGGQFVYKWVKRVQGSPRRSKVGLRWFKVIQGGLKGPNGPKMALIGKCLCLGFLWTYEDSNRLLGRDS